MLPHFSSALLSYAALLLAVGAASSSAYQYKNIFILAGQSNMAGRGGVVDDTWDGIVPPECRPGPSVLRLSAELEWVEAREPLHADIDTKRTCGVGPGMAFANAVLQGGESGFGVVGLVPCAVGGTNISEWRRGSRLYKELLRRTEAALEDGGSIRALLWCQGESDTVKQSDAESYGKKVEGFISNLRIDLQSPMLPVFQVALASGSGPYVDDVRAAQLGTDLPNFTPVDARGLSLEPDGLHLTTAAQVQLGQMLAHSFLQTLPRPSPLNSDAPHRGLSAIEPMLSGFFGFLLLIFANSVG